MKRAAWTFALVVVLFGGKFHMAQASGDPTLLAAIIGHDNAWFATLDDPGCERRWGNPGIPNSESCVSIHGTLTGMSFSGPDGDLLDTHVGQFLEAPGLLDEGYLEHCYDEWFGDGTKVRFALEPAVPEDGVSFGGQFDLGHPGESPIELDDCSYPIAAEVTSESAECLELRDDRAGGSATVETLRSDDGWATLTVLVL
jgi:hypothetical protein